MNEEMMAAFVATKGEKQRRAKTPKASEPRTKRTPIAKGKRPRQESPKQTDKRKLRSFAKACMVFAQIKTNGFTSCMLCGAQNPHPQDLHHIFPLGRGGKDEPGNFMLVCRPCHDREGGNQPLWSGKESA